MKMRELNNSTESTITDGAMRNARRQTIKSLRTFLIAILLETVVECRLDLFCALLCSVELCLQPTGNS